MFPGGIGIGEMILIAVVAVLLFGSRLPEVARNVGQAYQQFRKGLADIQSTIQAETDEMLKPKNLPDYVDSTPEPPSDFDEPSAPQFTPPPSDNSGPSA